MKANVMFYDDTGWCVKTSENIDIPEGATWFYYYFDINHEIQPGIPIPQPKVKKAKYLYNAGHWEEVTVERYSTDSDFKRAYPDTQWWHRITWTEIEEDV